MPRVYPGTPWQGQQYIEQLDSAVPDACATGQYAAVADAERHPGIPGWGGLADYSDVPSPQLGMRPGYNLPAAVDATVVGWLDLE